MRRAVLNTFLFVAILGLGCMGVTVPGKADDYCDENNPQYDPSECEQEGNKQKFNENRSRYFDRNFPTGDIDENGGDKLVHGSGGIFPAAGGIKPCHL
jgi:hypothetical protein